MEQKFKDTTSFASEFVIDRSQSSFLKADQEKLERLFKVKVCLKDVFNIKEAPKQWIRVEGSETDVNKAKEYIIALTSPEETIKLEDLWGRPMLTPSKEEEIEKHTGAVLSRCDNDGIAISGTAFAIALAQSMIDDFFSKVNLDSTCTGGRGENPSTDLNIVHSDTFHGQHPVSEIYRDKVDYNASLNQNNSSHTSPLSQQPSGSTCSGAQQFDNSVTADFPQSKATNPFASSLARSDFNHNCVSASVYKTSPLNSAVTLQGQLFSNHTGVSLYKNQKIFSDELPGAMAGLASSPERGSRFLFASASAISPMNTNEKYANATYNTQLEAVNHMVNQKGDGTLFKSSSFFASDKQQQIDRGPDQHNEVRMDVCYVDQTSSHLSDSPHAKDQQDYLRNLALGLHYSKEDIEKGLECYNMDEIIRPADFLSTLNAVKAQRHGRGLYDTTSERPVISQFVGKSAALISAASSETTGKTMVTTEISDLDDSVICMGSVSGDATALIISSEDESDEHEDVQPKVPESQPKPLVLKKNLLKADCFDGAEDCVPYQRPAISNNLRYIIIDGSNVAMAHGNCKVFSVRGLEICINYFLNRGHDRITAFVPNWRRYFQNQTLIKGKALLEKLNDKGYVKFTPSRRMDGATVASYDDRYILNLAEKEDGVIVSNDQFRDLCQEKLSYKNIVSTRLLPYLFVGDHFMPPDDPLGRHGPHLDEFLSYPLSIATPVAASSNTNRNAHTILPDMVKERKNNKVFPKLPRDDKMFQKLVKDDHNKGLPLRSEEGTQQLLQKLVQIFPDPAQKSRIHDILINHRYETDLNKLTNYCMNALFS